MKKKFILMLTFVLMFGILKFDSTARENYSVLNVDSKNLKLREVDMYLNDSKLKTDVPAVIYRNTSMVPVAVIARALKFDVKWDSKTRTVKIDGEKDIKIEIDKAEVEVEGKKKTLPNKVPAKIMNGRTMLPMRFVAEEFGCEVKWDGENYRAYMIKKEDKEEKDEDISKKEITNLKVKKYENEISSIVIEGNDELTYDHFVFEEENKSDRLIVDLEGFNFNLKNKELVDNRNIMKLLFQEENIKEIRAAQFSNDPQVTRFVIEFNEKANYKINKIEEEKIEIVFTENNDKEADETEEKLDEEKEEAEENKKGHETDIIKEDTILNIVDNIRLEEIDGIETIVVDNTEDVKHNIIRLSNPDRIVVDFMDSLLMDYTEEYQIETNSIKELRTSQFKPEDIYADQEKVVRIVLDLKSDKEHVNFNMESKDGSFYIYADEKKEQIVKYSNSGDKAKITLGIEDLKQEQCELNYNTNIYTLEAKIDLNNTNIQEGEVLVDDNLVDRIQVSKKDDIGFIKIKFKENMIYDKKLSNEGISISVKRSLIQENSKLIVIDAGHGGHDPGTLGKKDSTNEEHLALSVAKELDKELRSRGYRTLLTRDRDEFIELRERAYIANRADGDAFISIHYNSAENKSARGLELFYCPSFESDVKEEYHQYPFAKTMQEEIVKKLKMKDRGVKKNSKLVVTRETKMVAVLIEMGFLTNEAEYKRIITNEYFKESAEAIANGVDEYFKNK